MDLWMKMVLCKLKADTVISTQRDRNCQNKRFQKVCFRKLEQTFFPCGKQGRTNPLLTRGFAFSFGKRGGFMLQIKNLSITHKKDLRVPMSCEHYDIVHTGLFLLLFSG